MKKKIIALLTVLVMTAALIPVFSFADSDKKVAVPGTGLEVNEPAIDKGENILSGSTVSTFALKSTTVTYRCDGKALAYATFNKVYEQTNNIKPQSIIDFEGEKGYVQDEQSFTSKKINGYRCVGVEYKTDYEKSDARTKFNVVKNDDGTYTVTVKPYLGDFTWQPDDGIIKIRQLLIRIDFKYKKIQPIEVSAVDTEGNNLIESQKLEYVDGDGVEIVPADISGYKVVGWNTKYVGVTQKGEYRLAIDNVYGDTGAIQYVYEKVSLLSDPEEDADLDSMDSFYLNGDKFAVKNNKKNKSDDQFVKLHAGSNWFGAVGNEEIDLGIKKGETKDFVIYDADGKVIGTITAIQNGNGKKNYKITNFTDCNGNTSTY